MTGTIEAMVSFPLAGGVEDNEYALFLKVAQEGGALKDTLKVVPTTDDDEPVGASLRTKWANIWLSTDAIKELKVALAALP